jgi:ubiquinone/menaquinone biosynthesis C-methylase UbiE
MPDPYASIAEADQALQMRLADVLELRAADPQQCEMLRAYLSEIQLPEGADVLEVGCGTGAVTRALAQMPGVKAAVGVDPSPVFVAKARDLATSQPQLSFQIGDGRALPFADASFDFVVFHTTLCHVPDPDAALREARRVLRGGGWLSVFDGDYTTATVAIDRFDPLQPAVEAMVANFLLDPFLVRRLRHMLESMGLVISSFRSFGYTQTAEPTYMLTIVDRGADLLAAAGTVSPEAAEALKIEARRRVIAGTFFGHVSYVSAIARANTQL